MADTPSSKAVREPRYLPLNFSRNSKTTIVKTTAKPGLTSPKLLGCLLRHRWRPPSRKKPYANRRSPFRWSAHLSCDLRKLRDTVDAIPTCLIEAAEQRYVALGPVGHEEAMIANVQAIECQTPPKDAAEFLTTFDAGLRPAGLVFAAEHAAHQPQR